MGAPRKPNSQGRHQRVTDTNTENAERDGRRDVTRPAPYAFSGIRQAQTPYPLDSRSRRRPGGEGRSETIHLTDECYQKALIEERERGWYEAIEATIREIERWTSNTTGGSLIAAIRALKKP